MPPVVLVPSGRFRRRATHPVSGRPVPSRPECAARLAPRRTRRAAQGLLRKRATLSVNGCRAPSRAASAVPSVRRERRPRMAARPRDMVAPSNRRARAPAAGARARSRRAATSIRRHTPRTEWSGRSPRRMSADPIAADRTATTQTSSSVLSARTRQWPRVRVRTTISMERAIFTTSARRARR